MATLRELVEKGQLKPVRLRNLRPDEYENRKILATMEFWRWLNSDVRSLASFYREDIRPALQAHVFIKEFITGKPFLDFRSFKRLRPVTDDIWEFNTRDLRIFGWFPAKDVLIAVCGDTFERLKSNHALYDINRLACIKHRRDLDLDEPKYLKGADRNDVLS